jgi:hypothetical protein
MSTLEARPIRLPVPRPVLLAGSVWVQPSVDSNAHCRRTAPREVWLFRGLMRGCPVASEIRQIEAADREIHGLVCELRPERVPGAKRSGIRADAGGDCGGGALTVTGGG